MATRARLTLAVALAVAAGTVASGARAAETPDQAEARAFAERQAELAKNPDYALVPRFGRMHKSCIHALPAGADIDKDGNVTAGGKRLSAIPACAFPEKRPALKHSMTAALPPSDKLPTINGWVEYTWQWAPSGAGVSPWFTQMDATFVVPSAPSSYTGQTIFLFPSMEPGTGNSIIQPVIQYGPSAAGGGGYWTITNWYVLANGSAVYGPLATIAAGDTILGSINVVGSTCNANGSNCRYCIGYTRNNGGLVSITVQSPDIYNWAQVGVLEVYGVSNCNQLPASGSSVFTLGTYTQAGSPTWSNRVGVTASFTGTVSGGLNPSCSYQATALTNGTTLNY